MSVAPARLMEIFPRFPGDVRSVATETGQESVSGRDPGVSTLLLALAPIAGFM